MADSNPDGPRVQGSSLSRREFGKAIGLAGAVHAAPAIDALAAPPVAPDEPLASADAIQAGASRPAVDVYAYFTADEAAFVEAAVDRLIPPDDLGPGAREAGVAVYIDRQLDGTYGSAGKWYMQGPWGESVREQGYQIPLTPRQLYRLCIAEIDRHLVAQRGARFSDLPAADRDAVLSSIERGALTIAGVPLTMFFDMLLGNTMEGFFADPVYGGNRDKAGWRLVGFPGVAASYLNRIERYNEPYRVEPIGITDVLERRVAQDEHGHVVHPPLDTDAPVRRGGR